MFSGLVQYDEGANIVPDVAERWEISRDGLRYTFRLRSDVTWSDGHPVTAHDFVTSYRRALDPATEAELAPDLLLQVAGAREIREARAPAERAAIHAVDDRTLLIELVKPTSYFMYNLAHEMLVPLPRHLVEAHGQDWCRPETIVSNGAFQLATWEPGHGMTLERNPRYHGPVSGNVQRLSLKITEPGDDSHEQLYQADEVDVLVNWLGTTSGVIDRLRRRFPYEYVRADGSTTIFYVVDPNSPPLNDRRLRQAMAMAVDRNSLVAQRPPCAAAEGGFTPPGTPGHVPGVAIAHNPGRAAQLIADVFGTDVSPMTIMCSEVAEPAFQQLVDQWRSVGLRLEIKLFAQWSDQMVAWNRTSGPKIATSAWIADYPDPDTFLRVAVQQHLPSWRHSRYESLLEKAGRTSDTVGRLELYRLAEQVLAEEAVLVPLLYDQEHLMIKPWVTGFPTVPVLYPRALKDVVIGPHVAEQR
jgi:oligopeptide transport system substrate-binding protein